MEVYFRFGVDLKPCRYFLNVEVEEKSDLFCLKSGRFEFIATYTSLLFFLDGCGRGVDGPPRSLKAANKKSFQNTNIHSKKMEAL